MYTQGQKIISEAFEQKCLLQNLMSSLLTDFQIIAHKLVFTSDEAKTFFSGQLFPLCIRTTPFKTALYFSSILSL